MNISLKNIIHPYMNIPRNVLRLIVTELILNTMYAAFFLIMNIYLRKEGYTDPQIAGFISFQYLGAFLFAFPFGIYIKGKKLKPFLVFTTLLVPFTGLLIILSIRYHFIFLVKTGFFLWGTGLMVFQVCILPFLLRNVKKDTLPESISLSFSAWSLAVIGSGIIITMVRQLINLFHGKQPDEFLILLGFVAVGLVAALVSPGIIESPPRSASGKFFTNLRNFSKDYDWRLILKALIPTLIIAVGAGLTIPFVNLFFFSVFHLDSHQFSILGSAAAGLGVMSALLVPWIRRRFGYGVAILLTQSIAIVFLVGLALTEVYATYEGILWVAIFFYLFRQPFMHMAAPITSELTMQYVGENNQELLSAMNSTMWSASWFVSAKIFQSLRAMDLHYYQIFFITAALYSIGVFGYRFIIREFHQRNVPHSR